MYVKEYAHSAFKHIKKYKGLQRTSLKKKFVMYVAFCKSGVDMPAPLLGMVYLVFSEVLSTYDGVFNILEGLFDLWNGVFCIWDGVFRIWDGVY